MVEIIFTKIPIIVGNDASSRIEIGPGYVRMTVQQAGQKLELVMPADEAQGMGCGFVVAAHAAKQLGAQQAIRPISKGKVAH